MLRKLKQGYARLLVNPGRNPCTVPTRGRVAGFLSWYSRRTELDVAAAAPDRPGLTLAETPIRNQPEWANRPDFSLDDMTGV